MGWSDILRIPAESQNGISYLRDAGLRLKPAKCTSANTQVKVTGKCLADYGTCVGGLRGLQYIELTLP